MNHTPGPWEAVLALDKRGQPSPMYRGLVALVENRLAVVHASGDTVQKEQWEAHCRLIAAAPDLLAACESAIDFLAPHMDMIRDQLEMAINKATKH